MKAHPDLVLLECESYEQYLNSFLKPEDRRFLRNDKVSRMLVEMGHRSANVYTPEEFEKRKVQLHDMLLQSKKEVSLFSVDLKFTDLVLCELAAREGPNKDKILSTIIFLRYRTKAGFHISAYIDYEQSLRHAYLRIENADDWRAIFSGHAKLKPKRTDLSYYDWHKNIVHHNDTENYTIIHDVKRGLIFMHRGDHKKICVNPANKQFTENFTRSMVYSESYGHVIFYDHKVHKKL